MTSRSDIGDETVALVSEEPEEESSFEVVGADEAGISVLDRGFLYGDAVFETLRCYGSEPAFLGEHVDLLNSSLERLGFGIEVETSEARLWVEEMLAQLPDATDGDHDDAYVRLCVTRGEREGLLEPTEARPTLVCIAKRLTRRRYPSASCEVVGTRRLRGVVGELKTHNYLPNVLAKSEAGDVDEALMRNSEGEIASGAVSNLFVLRDGVLRTSCREVRKGVTRGVVLGIADELGMAVEREGVEEFEPDDSAFLTNSTWGVREVSDVGGITLDTSAEVERVSEAYYDRVLPSCSTD